jgi:DNA-directed RNA polymerase subunit L
MGFEAMASRMQRLSEKLSDSASEDVEDEEPLSNSPDVSSLKKRGETETAGALLQAYLLGENGDEPTLGRGNTGNQKQQSFGSCDFCGYFSPHPLQSAIIIRLRARDAAAASARDLVRDASLAISVRAQQLADDWRFAAGLDGDYQKATRDAVPTPGKSSSSRGTELKNLEPVSLIADGDGGLSEAELDGATSSEEDDGATSESDISEEDGAKSEI